MYHMRVKKKIITHFNHRTKRICSHTVYQLQMNEFRMHFHVMHRRVSSFIPMQFCDHVNGMTKCVVLYSTLVECVFCKLIKKSDQLNQTNSPVFVYRFVYVCKIQKMACKSSFFSRPCDVRFCFGTMWRWQKFLIFLP